MPNPTPQSNVERYLSVIAGHAVELPSQPASRVEWYLDEIVRNGDLARLKPTPVEVLPETGDPSRLYLVPVQGSSGENTHDEYLWIEDWSKYELLGQARIEVVGVSVTAVSPIIATENSGVSSVSYEISHEASGVTPGSKGESANQTPGFGGTFKATSGAVDANGHVTAFAEHTVKIPDDKVTDAKDGLMSKEDKAKLDKLVPKGSATKGVYIDTSGNTQAMEYSLNADVPENFAAATAAPLMDGAAAVGTSAKYAREDHRHPSDAAPYAWIQYAVGENVPDFIVSDNAADEIYSYSNRGGTRGVSDPVIFVNCAPASDDKFWGMYQILGRTKAAVTLSGEHSDYVNSFKTYTTPAGNTVHAGLCSGWKRLNHVSTCVVNGVPHTLTVPANDPAASAVAITAQFLAVVDAVLFGDTEPVGGTGSVVWRENREAERNRVAALESENVLLRELISGVDAPIYRTASGNPATFADGKAANLKDVRVTITPTQSGSGDPSPSNIRPISGVSSVTVTRTGENGANSQSVTVSLTDGSNPLTVYGGTLDVTTGELTVTHGAYTFTGQEYFSEQESQNRIFRQISAWAPAMKPGEWTNDTTTLCSMIPKISITDQNSGGIVFGANNDYIYIYHPEKYGFTYGGGPAAALAEMQVVYPLATPVAYQLTPAQLAALAGYNSVSADAGSVSVTYLSNPSIVLGGGA